jgi:hypothetical protein
MLSQGELILSAFVLLNPLQQHPQIRVLRFAAGILVRLPRARPTVLQARLVAGIQEDHFSAIAGRLPQKAGITAFDDPVF